MEARELLIAGTKPEDVISKTGLTAKTVKYIGNWLKSPDGQEYVTATEELRKTPAPVPPVGLGTAAGSAKNVDRGQELLRQQQSRRQQEQQLQEPLQEPPGGLIFTDPGTGLPIKLAEGQGMEVEDALGQSYMLVQTPDSTRGNPLQVRISPWTLIWYQVCEAEARQRGLKEGYTGGITQFIEDCIRSYMKLNGKRFTYVSEVD